jgi:hypothetical protein
MDFNLDTIEASRDTTYEAIIGKRADGRKVGFTVLGTGSAAYAEATRKIELLNIKQAAQRQKDADNGTVNQVDGTTDEGAAIIVDTTTTHRMILAMTCTVGWFGFVVGTDETQDAPFDAARLEGILRAKPLWSRKIVEVIEADGSFTKG